MSSNYQPSNTGSNRSLVQPEPLEFQNQNNMSDQQRNNLLSTVSALESTAASSSTIQSSKVLHEILPERSAHMLRNVFPTRSITVKLNPFEIRQQQPQVTQHPPPTIHNYQHHLHLQTVQNPQISRQHCLSNKQNVDSNCFQCFCFSEPQTHRVDPLQSTNPFSSELRSENDFDESSDINIYTNEAEVSSQPNTLSIAVTTSENILTPEKCSSFPNLSVLQPSNPLCDSTPIMPQPPFIPNSNSAPTERLVRDTGHGTQQFSSSFHHSQNDCLHLPMVIPTDNIVEYCKTKLHSRRIQSYCRNNQTLYYHMLNRLKIATKANKSCERKKLKRKSAETVSVDFRPNNMEAKLSRYKEDVYTVLLHYELKRVSRNFLVLRKFVEMHSSQWEPLF